MTADAVYGSDYKFRTALENQGLGYVIVVRSDFAAWVGFRHLRAKTLLDDLSPEAWQRLSCGDSSKGPRQYDWAILRTNCPEAKTRTR